MHALHKISTNLLFNKIKISLFKLGLNEKYIAFDYLSYILTYFIRQNDCSYKSYKNIVDLLSQRFETTSKTITQSLNSLLKKCTLLNLSNLYTFHKIQMIKTYFEQNHQ